MYVRPDLENEAFPLPLANQPQVLGIQRRRVLQVERQGGIQKIDADTRGH